MVGVQRKVTAHRLWRAAECKPCRHARKRGPGVGDASGQPVSRDAPMELHPRARSGYKDAPAPVPMQPDKPNCSYITYLPSPPGRRHVRSAGCASRCTQRLRYEDATAPAHMQPNEPCASKTSPAISTRCGRSWCRGCWCWCSPERCRCTTSPLSAASTSSCVLAVCGCVTECGEGEDNASIRT